MRRRLAAVFRVLLASAALALPSTLAAEDAARPANEGDEFFGLAKLHEFHLTVSAKDYAALEPPQPASPFGPPGGRPSDGPGGGSGRPPSNRPAPGSPDFGAGNFGFEFEYVHADVEIDGQTLKDVGLRYKGSGTYMVSQRSAKRSFKIDFDRHDEKQTLGGLAKLNLNNGVMDVSKAREVLAYEVFRAAGVPAPRTAFAEVTLSVPGKFDREYLGVYTVVEQVDDDFLKRHFGSCQGLLLKPEGIKGLPHFGDDPTVYHETYVPKTEGDEMSWRRLVELTRLINKADEAEFAQQIGEVLDTKNFARFLAANTMLASLDGFIGLGHNYYLYLSPETNKFAIFPWDLDLAFGAFPMYGSPEQLLKLSIDHPHVGENKLIDRLLALDDFKSAYREQLKTIATDVFATARIGKNVQDVEGLLKDLLPKDRRAAEARGEQGAISFGGPGYGGPPRSLTDSEPESLAVFIRKRTASVVDQLAGNGKGYVPASSFGFRGFDGGQRGGAVGGPPGGGGFRSPGGFDPANLLARPLLDKLDTDKDGDVTDDEFSGGMTQLFEAWDADKSGALDEREIAAGLQKLAPPPAVPSFNSPPGWPPGPPPTPPRRQPGRPPM